MSNLDDAIAENTAFDLLEIRQAKRASKQTATTVTIDTSILPVNHYQSIWKNIKTGSEYEK